MLAAAVGTRAVLSSVPSSQRLSLQARGHEEFRGGIDDSLTLPKVGAQHPDLTQNGIFAP